MLCLEKEKKNSLYRLTFALISQGPNVMFLNSESMQTHNTIKY